MVCTTVGQIEFTVVPAWERLFMYNGRFGIPENYSPVDFKNPDMRMFQDFQHATKYNVKLSAGDCIYLPPYWWYQMETAGSIEAIAVMHYYQISSSWLRAVFNGIERH